MAGGIYRNGRVSIEVDKNLSIYFILSTRAFYLKLHIIKYFFDFLNLGLLIIVVYQILRGDCENNLFPINL